MSATPATRTDSEPRLEAAVNAAVASSERPPRPSALANCLTFGWRGMLKIKHVPEQLLDVTVTPVLFLLMFTYLFGGAVAGSTDEYLQFILPGVLAQSVLFTAVYSGVALNTDITKGVVDRFRSLPVWRPAPLVGAVVGDSARYVIAATIVMRARLHHGLRGGRRGARRGRRGRARGGVHVRAELGVHHHRAGHARAQRGAQHRLHGALPARVPEQHLRRAVDAPELARDASSTSTRSRTW